MNLIHFSFAAILIISSGLSCKPAIDNKKESTSSQVLYKEKHRPQFHFSPPQKWMNDPNGMVYFDGEYHLFYQYYPDSIVWGPMHWGHAVSTDMVRWKNLPIALYPDSLGYIFSGSAVVDWKNTSGFGKNSLPPLVAIYTYHDPVGVDEGRTNFQTQGIAYSLDKGRTWAKYAGNPVIGNADNLRDIRDPKVFWHETSKKWIMVLSVFDHIQLYGSKDLKSWTHLSDWGKEYGGHDGVWECPDLFEMQTKDGMEKRWVLILNINPGAPHGGSGTQYFIGDFDGINFTLDKSFIPLVENKKGVWLDDGRDNYAGVTWSDIPATDGRRLFMGWMSNWEYAQKVPTEIWRSAMTIPRELTLKKSGNDYRLLMNPVRELESLRSKSYTIPATTITGELDLTSQLPFSPDLLELILDFEIHDTSTTSISLVFWNNANEEYRIGYDIKKQQFFSDRSKSGDLSFSEKFGEKIYSVPRSLNNNVLRMHVYVDVASMELFADDGATCMTEIFFPSEDFNHLKIISNNGAVKLSNGEAFALQSIWKN